MSSPLRRLGVTVAVVGAVVLVAAAVLALINVTPVGLAGPLKIGGYVGLGLVALGLVSAVAASTTTQPPG